MDFVIFLVLVHLECDDQVSGENLPHDAVIEVQAGPSVHASRAQSGNSSCSSSSVGVMQAGPSVHASRAQSGNSSCFSSEGDSEEGRHRLLFKMFWK